MTIVVQKNYQHQHLVKISAPVLVIKMVCSNCAAGLPSAVSVVQLSGHVMESMLPNVSIGSAVEVEFVGHKSTSRLNTQL